MDGSRVEALLAWIGQNPLLAGAVIFLVAFGDALVLVGIAIPSLPVLFGVGTLIGLGLVDPTYAIVCAAVGAFSGDGLSYLIGRWKGEALRRAWPFSRHPEWLGHGERFFRRHGTKGIFIARYVGAVRPFVPVVAGMLHMPTPRYLAASAVAAATWAVLFIAPGWLFGAWLELLARIAGRLAIVVGLLLATLGLIGIGIFAAYRVLAPRTAMLVERALAWSHRHPVLGRFSIALIDPRRPESASLALLALGLVLAGWTLFALLIFVAGNGEPMALDLAVHRGLLAVRNPLADAPMAVFARLGDWAVLLPAIMIVFAWLWWRQRHFAAWHWAAAPAFALLLVAALGALIDAPRPPAALLTPGFSFPSAPVTLATVVFGFFAVLVARELPGRRRAWPYVLGALLVGLIGFSRLYFGAHWLSDVLGGVLLGGVFITALGLAYRRRILRSFWARPVSLLFFAAVFAAAAWHGPRNITTTLAQFEPPTMVEPMAADLWWRSGWRQLPQHRDTFKGRDRWPLNVEIAGPLDTVRVKLVEAGWRSHPQAGWEDFLRLFDNAAEPSSQPLLPASHGGHADALLMSAPAAHADERVVLRLWPSRFQLAPEATPVWVGTAETARFTQRWNLLSYWEVVPDRHAAAREQLAQALAPWPTRTGAHATGAPATLRARVPDEGN